jgi:hypothetical protein
MEHKIKNAGNATAYALQHNSNFCWVTTPRGYYSDEWTTKLVVDRWNGRAYDVPVYVEPRLVS